MPRRRSSSPCPSPSRRSRSLGPLLVSCLGSSLSPTPPCHIYPPPQILFKEKPAQAPPPASAGKSSTLHTIYIYIYIYILSIKRLDNARVETSCASKAALYHVALSQDDISLLSLSPLEQGGTLPCCFITVSSLSQPHCHSMSWSITTLHLIVMMDQGRHRRRRWQRSLQTLC
jgi:hypothetical protein